MILTEDELTVKRYMEAHSRYLGMQKLVGQHTPNHEWYIPEKKRKDGSIRAARTMHRHPTKKFAKRRTDKQTRLEVGLARSLAAMRNLEGPMQKAWANMQKNRSTQIVPEYED